MWWKNRVHRFKKLIGCFKLAFVYPVVIVADFICFILSIGYSPSFFDHWNRWWQSKNPERIRQFAQANCPTCNTTTQVWTHKNEDGEVDAKIEIGLTLRKKPVKTKAKNESARSRKKRDGTRKSR